MKNKYIILWFFIFAGEFLLAYILSFFKEGYSNIDMPLSALGAGNDLVSKVYSTWQVLSGIGMIVVFLQFYIYNKEVMSKKLLIGIGLMIFFAIGSCIISGIFKVDETKEMVTISAKIHGWFSVLAFSGLNFVPLFMMKYFKNVNFNHGTLISLVTFILSIAFYILIILSDKEEFINTFIEHNGIWQRLFLLNIYSYMSVLFTRSLKVF